MGKIAAECLQGVDVLTDRNASEPEVAILINPKGCDFEVQVEQESDDNGGNEGIIGYPKYKTSAPADLMRSVSATTLKMLGLAKPPIEASEADISLVASSHTNGRVAVTGIYRGMGKMPNIEHLVEVE